MQADEAATLAFHPRRDEDVDCARAWGFKPVPADRTRAADQAPFPRVEQGGYLPVVLRDGPAVGQVDAGQQNLPRAARRDLVIDVARRHAAGKRLRPQDHPPLIRADPVKLVGVITGSFRHGYRMTQGSDIRTPVTHWK